MMKQIVLDSISLHNWRGQTCECHFKATENLLTGKNGSGKSSVFNAFLWLLTGADDHDRCNYMLFDCRLPMTFENARAARVEAKFYFADSVQDTFTLAREASPKWERRRGSAEYEKAPSDNYAYFINGVATSSKDYNKFVEETFAPTAKLKLMLNLQQTRNVEWKELRAHFEDIAGKVRDEDMKGDYTAIRPLLGKHSIEEIKPMLQAEISKLRADVGTAKKDGTLSIKINALKSTLPDMSKVSDARERIDGIKERITELDSQIVGARDALAPYIKARNNALAHISTLHEQYSKAEAAYLVDFNNLKSKLMAEKAEIGLQNAAAEKWNAMQQEERKNALAELERLRHLAASLRARHEELTKANAECKGRVFTNGTCAYCGQQLPADKLKLAEIKFYEEKEREHEYIVAQGKANREKLDGTEEAISILEKKTSTEIQLRPLIDTAAIEAKLSDLDASFVPYKETPAGREKAAEIEKEEANLPIVPTTSEAVFEEKKKLMAEMDSLQKECGRAEEYDRQMSIIERLENDLRETAVKLAETEGKLAKATEYERERATIIAARVNEYFKYVHVTMTGTRKDGELIDTCTIRNSAGVNMMLTNAADFIVCGIDLARGLQRHYGVSLPLFIDDSELVNKWNFPKDEGQAIKLVVSEAGLNVEN